MRRSTKPATPLLGTDCWTFDFALNRQGTRAVVVSWATNLVPGFVDGGVGRDMFVIDLSSLSVRLVSDAVGSATLAANGATTSKFTGCVRILFR